MTDAVTTTDHDAIRKWVEDRDGHPARVKGQGDGGLLRIDFGEPHEDLERISWDDFFAVFEENRLAFLHQERTHEGVSRFNKLVNR